jgi:N-(2-amino-2-carboxyethyl)-L-glutamate synthase
VRVIRTPQEFNVPDLYIDLRRVAGHRLYLKCEGFNFAGSVKLKAAAAMVTAAERAGRLRPGCTVAEISSGNIGVALAMVAASRGYRFVCVTDPECTLACRQLMQSLGVEVHVVNGRHPLGRVRLMRKLCAENKDYVWLDQYRDPASWTAHHDSTGPEVLKTFPDLDVLFVGVGTGGILAGCASYLREAKPGVRIVAIGCGYSRILDRSQADDLVWVSEADSIRACRSLARRGFVLGASTGAVLGGAMSWLKANGGEDITAVAISPDLGDRYLDTVYQDQWVWDRYGPDTLDEVRTDARVEIR